MKFRLFYVICFFALGTGFVYSQPKATVEFFGGYCMPLADQKGSFGSTAATVFANSDSLTYFMKGGVNYGLAFKKPVNKKANLNLTVSINFNAFGQTGEYDSVTVKVKQNILSFGIGAEWQFAPLKSKINPFAGVEFTGSLINGSLAVSYSTSSSNYGLGLKQAFRLGLNMNAGVDFVLHQNVGLVAGARYSFANLFLKSSDTDTQNNYFLNDGEHTAGGYSYKNRSINYLQIYGGVSFYFGK